MRISIRDYAGLSARADEAEGHDVAVFNFGSERTPKEEVKLGMK